MDSNHHARPRVFEDVYAQVGRGSLETHLQNVAVDGGVPNVSGLLKAVESFVEGTHVAGSVFEVWMHKSLGLGHVVFGINDAVEVGVVNVHSLEAETLVSGDGDDCAHAAHASYRGEGVVVVNAFPLQVALGDAPCFPLNDDSLEVSFASVDPRAGYGFSSSGKFLDVERLHFVEGLHLIPHGFLPFFGVWCLESLGVVLWILECGRKVVGLGGHWESG